MPGRADARGLAQTAALLSFESAVEEPDDDSVVYFRRHRRRALQAAGGAGRPADPGSHHRPRQGRHLQVQGAATVDGEVAAEAELMCTMRKVA
jgi:3-hydroxyacyl-[acyl-carrier-protein] dehydratase